MVERIARHAQAEVCLVGSLRMDLDPRVSVCLEARGVGRARRRRLEVAEVPLDVGLELAVDLARDSDDHALRVVTLVDVAEVRVPGRAADSLLAADDILADGETARDEHAV